MFARPTLHPWAEGQAGLWVRNGGETQTRLGTCPELPQPTAPKESLVMSDVRLLKQLNRSVHGSGLHTEQMLRLSTCWGSQPTLEHQKWTEGHRICPGSLVLVLHPAARSRAPSTWEKGNTDDTGMGEGEAVGAHL